MWIHLFQRAFAASTVGPGNILKALRALLHNAPELKSRIDGNHQGYMSHRYAEVLTIEGYDDGLCKWEAAENHCVNIGLCANWVTGSLLSDCLPFAWMCLENSFLTFKNQRYMIYIAQTTLNLQTLQAWAGVHINRPSCKANGSAVKFPEFPGKNSSLNLEWML